MNVILIYDSFKSNNALFLDNLKESIFCCLKDADLIEIDMSKISNLNKCFYKIIAEDPALIITLDGAGFEFRTEADDLSFNQLPCKMAHIFLSENRVYEKALEDRQNFQMYTYVPDDEPAKLWIKNYPEIPNIKNYKKYKSEAAGEQDKIDNAKSVSDLVRSIAEDLWISRETSI